jgi:hypothetical protein
MNCIAGCLPFAAQWLVGGDKRRYANYISASRFLYVQLGVSCMFSLAFPVPTISSALLVHSAPRRLYVQLRAAFFLAWCIWYGQLDAPLFLAERSRAKTEQNLHHKVLDILAKTHPRTVQEMQHLAMQQRNRYFAHESFPEREERIAIPKRRRIELRSG